MWGEIATSSSGGRSPCGGLLTRSTRSGADPATQRTVERWTRSRGAGLEFILPEGGSSGPSSGSEGPAETVARFGAFRSGRRPPGGQAEAEADQARRPWQAEAGCARCPYVVDAAEAEDKRRATWPSFRRRSTSRAGAIRQLFYDKLETLMTTF